MLKPSLMWLADSNSKTTQEQELKQEDTDQGRNWGGGLQASGKV